MHIILQNLDQLRDLVEEKDYQYQKDQNFRLCSDRLSYCLQEYCLNRRFEQFLG